MLASLLKRLWTWYGTRQGYLSTAGGMWMLYHEGIPGARAADTITWRGEMIKDTRTAIFRANPASILVWNRYLTDAEIDMVKAGWKAEPQFDGCAGAIIPTPAPMGTADFTTPLCSYAPPEPDRAEGI